MSQANQSFIRGLLPDGDFSLLVIVLRKFLRFIKLTVSTILLCCIYLISVNCYLSSAQNHRWLTDNVWPEWSLDRPTTLLASHVGRSCRLLCLGQRAKSSPANFRFCLFVKIQSCSLIENSRSISSLFFLSFWLVRKWDLTKQKFFGPVIMLGHRQKLFWALTEVIWIPVFLN